MITTAALLWRWLASYWAAALLVLTTAVAVGVVAGFRALDLPGAGWWLGVTAATALLWFVPAWVPLTLHAKASDDTLRTLVRR